MLCWEVLVSDSQCVWRSRCLGRIIVRASTFVRGCLASDSLRGFAIDTVQWKGDEVSNTEEPGQSALFDFSPGFTAVIPGVTASQPCKWHDKLPNSALLGHEPHRCPTSTIQFHSGQCIFDAHLPKAPNRHSAHPSQSHANHLSAAGSLPVGRLRDTPT